MGFGGTNGEITHFTGRERGDVVDEIIAVDPDTTAGPPGLNNPEWWQVENAIRLWWVDRTGNATSGTGPVSQAYLVLQLQTVGLADPSAPVTSTVIAATTLWSELRRGPFPATRPQELSPSLTADPANKPRFSPNS